VLWTRSLTSAVDLSGVLVSKCGSLGYSVAVLELICMSKVTSSVLRLIIILINAFTEKIPSNSFPVFYRAIYFYSIITLPYFYITIYNMCELYNILGVMKYRVDYKTL
jgi:hypothetical protein